jgi:hypothetical protein
MGTNYYWRHNICPHCGRYDEIHIGKSSMGWQFILHGYRDNPVKISTQETFILSWSEWKLLLNEGRIFNEYGKEVSLEYLIDNVEAPERKTMTNHYDYCQEHHEGHLKEMWKDSEGYCLCDSEFS